MRTKIIVPAVVVIGLLCWLMMRPHPQSHEVPARITPQKNISPELQPVASPQPVSPAVTRAAETPTELVLAKLQAWDDDDQPALREQRMQELAALLDGTNAWDIIADVPANLMGYVFAVPSGPGKDDVGPGDGFGLDVSTCECAVAVADISPGLERVG